MENILNLFKHIFGAEKADWGLNWFAYLLKEPKYKLPAIILVSKQNNTGKSTFIKFMKAAFAEHSAIVVQDTFMSTEAISKLSDKTLIMCDEIVKRPGFMNRLKQLNTSEKIIKVLLGNVTEIPFYGHFILTTNSPEFKAIPDANLSFSDMVWILEVPPIPADKLNLNIDSDLQAELPAFFDYIEARVNEICISTNPQS